MKINRQKLLHLKMCKTSYNFTKIAQNTKKKKIRQNYKTMRDTTVLLSRAVFIYLKISAGKTNYVTNTKTHEFQI